MRSAPPQLSPEPPQAEPGRFASDDVGVLYDPVSARSLLAEMHARWTDASLRVEDEMYGQKWARGLTLAILIAHQTHHRGQMTVLMRQAGLKVPGIYGPAREEWAAMGLNPPEV